MRITSYYVQGKELPTGIDAAWPVPFLEGFAAYLKNFENSDCYILQDESTGILIPLQVKHVRFFKFGQLLFAPCRNAEPVSAEDQQKFFERLIPFLRKEKLCHRLIQPHPMGMTAAKPTSAQWCHFGTYMNDLQTGTDEELLHTFDPKYRKAVQHSIKNGGRVEFGPQVLDDFYKLYTTTTSRAKIYTDPISTFEAQLKHLGNHAEPGVVYDENGPIGSIFNLWSGYHSLCTHAGSGGESKLYGAMKHLHYAMMLRMKARGVRWYDLVGVRINSDHPALQGVFRFKKGFGGELREGYLWKSEISPLAGNLFDLMLRLRNKGHKPHGDIIDQENESRFSTEKIDSEVPVKESAE